MVNRVDRTVVGVFDSHDQAQRAVKELLSLGFMERQIGVASKQGTVSGAGNTEVSDASSGAATGAAAGLGVGALWGIGIAAGLLPAIGPVIAGGTLAAIAASAATGAAAAGLAGALLGAGLSDEDAAYYDDEFNHGRVIVTVDAGSRTAEVESVISRYEGHSRPVSV